MASRKSTARRSTIAYRPAATAVSHDPSYPVALTNLLQPALHFHLTVASEEEAKAAGEAYEDVEFAYTPHLDANRDRDLLDILPDYLMEEICFPRNNAAKFYAKIVECITKKIVIEE